MDKLQELIEQLSKSNPKFLEGLEQAAAAGIRNDKMALYNLLVKQNPTFDYKALDTILTRHENQRLDINWNIEDYIYRIVVSKRQRRPEKVRKPRTRKTNGNDTPNPETKATGT